MLVYSPAPGLGRSRLGAVTAPTTACVQAPCGEAPPPLQTIVLPPPTQAVTSPPIMCVKAPCNPGTVQTAPPTAQQVATTTAPAPAPVAPNALPSSPAPGASVTAAEPLLQQPIPYAKILAGVGVLFLGFSAVKFLSR